ncbi:MAG TPA: MFS transporter, partial [Gaiellaceae bacterium]|nr:MFS transporter [Gaiellaceae bacterium]
AAAAGLVALVCLSPQLARSRRARAAAGRAAGSAGQKGAAPSIDPTQRALLYLVSFAVFFALGSMPQTLLPLIGADHYRLSAGVVGLLLGVGGVCRFVGAAVGGVVADRYSRKAALVPSLLTMGAGAVLLELPGGPVVWVSSIVLLSLGSFGVTVAATMLADLGGGVRVGRRLGSFRFVGDFGLVIGPLVAGWLYDALGTGAAVAAVGGLLAVCALVAAVALDETRHLPVPVGLDVVG